MPDTVIIPPTSVIGGAEKKETPASKGIVYDKDFAELDEPLVEEAEEEETEEDTHTAIAEDEEEKEEEITEAEAEAEAEKPDIPFDRPSVREIKTKYPEFFKDFPSLKESFFREIEFTKIFPTVDDAKEAFTENEAFSVLQESALAGNPEPVLKSLADTDPNAFELFALSFLPSLYKQNQDVYNAVTTPLLQNLVRSLVKNKDENTKNAGYVLANYIFGDEGEQIADGKLTAVKKDINKLTEDQNKQRDSRETALTTKFRESAGKVHQNITKNLEALVLKNPAYDPNKTFSPFLRKQGAQEVIKRVMKSLESDQGHMTVMGARWKRARANGYTSDDESKIIATYLARAKSLIPDACSKVSAAMLGSKQRAATDRSARVDRSVSTRKENNSGRVSGSGNLGSLNGKSKQELRKMSDMDILNAD